jgi:hypothetical protein
VAAEDAQAATLEPELYQKIEQLAVQGCSLSGGNPVLAGCH